MSDAPPAFMHTLLPVAEDVQTTLSCDVYLEQTCPGRYGAVLVRPVAAIAESSDAASTVSAASVAIPLVRSTTAYATAAQHFPEAHKYLLQNIRDCIGDAEGINGFDARLDFNNALQEQYTARYRTMGMHTDQALDLRDDSFICLFSTYSNPEVAACDLRQLVVKNKTTGTEQRIVLVHGSLVWFSVRTNAQYWHQIVPIAATAKGTEADTVWLGITFRCSKRALTLDNKGAALLEDGQQLVLLTDKERKSEYFKERRAENTAVGAFEYSAFAMHSTISPSDLLPVVWHLE